MIYQQPLVYAKHFRPHSKKQRTFGEACPNPPFAKGGTKIEPQISRIALLTLSVTIFPLATIHCISFFWFNQAPV